MRPEEIEDKLTKAPSTLREAHRIQCSLTAEELLTYITAPTYEKNYSMGKEILVSSVI